MAKEPDWKSGKAKKTRGFESHVLRQMPEISTIPGFFRGLRIGYSWVQLCCPGERDLNTSIFKLSGSFFPCRSVITVIVQSSSGIIVTNIILYGSYVHVRVNKR